MLSRILAAGGAAVLLAGCGVAAAPEPIPALPSTGISGDPAGASGSADDSTAPDTDGAVKPEGAGDGTGDRSLQQQAEDSQLREQQRYLYGPSQVTDRAATTADIDRYADIPTRPNPPGQVGAFTAEQTQQALNVAVVASLFGKSSPASRVDPSGWSSLSGDLAEFVQFYTPQGFDRFSGVVNQIQYTTTKQALAGQGQPVGALLWLAAGLCDGPVARCVTLTSFRLVDASTTTVGERTGLRLVLNETYTAQGSAATAQVSGNVTYVLVPVAEPVGAPWLISDLTFNGYTVTVTANR